MFAKVGMSGSGHAEQSPSEGRYNFRPRKEIRATVKKFLEAKKRKINQNFVIDDDDEDREWSSDPSVLKKANIVAEDAEEEEELEDENDDDEQEEPDEEQEDEEPGDDENEDEEQSGGIIDGLTNLLKRVTGTDKDDDWCLDTSVLSGILTKGVKEAFPELDVKRLRSTIDDVLADTGDDLIKEYCGAVPKDVSWKANLSDEKVVELEPKLEQIRMYLAFEEPTMDKILEAPATLEDRAKLIQKFDIYKNLEPYTEDHFVLRQSLCLELESRKNLNVLEAENLAAEEKRIKTKHLVSTAVPALKKRILGLDTTDEIKSQLLEMYAKLQDTSSDSSMWSALKEKLEWAVALPYRKLGTPKVVYGVNSNAEINAYCAQVRATLDSKLYGMDKVKDELIAILNNRITNPRAIGTLALKGPPGVGKTAIVAALAEAIGRPFERIALGGMQDATTLKGADSHWLGSNPSILIHILKRMKVADGIVLLDEIDKLSGKDNDNPQGANIQHALLHITDYTQNHEFTDAFLNEFPHDLSNIWYMYGMNQDEWLDPVLKDRLTILEIEPYTPREMTEIIKRHLLPEALKNVNIPRDQVSITDNACSQILTIFADQIKETGVRPVQRAIRTLATRINLLRTNTLPDGTTGQLKIRFAFPGFKLPLVIDNEVVDRLIEVPKGKVLTYFT